MKPRASRLLKVHISTGRITLVGTLILAGFVAVSIRAFYWQGLNTAYLQGKGDAVSVRNKTLEAPRGNITDRHGFQLAVSTPVETLWARAQDLHFEGDQRAEVARILGMTPAELTRRLGDRKTGEFALKRPVTPQQALELTEAKLTGTHKTGRTVVDPRTRSKIAETTTTGLYLRREYRRYYPTREVAAHVVGFTDIDGIGREGVERAYQNVLAAEQGERHYLRDNLGNMVRDLTPVKAARHGTDLALSLDQKLQYIAHRELAAAVEKHKAKGGSIVVLDAKTGEILALANFPDFNPNNRQNYQPAPMRNRAVVDAFEPGSTIKPFVAAAALERGLVKPDTVIDIPRALQVDYKSVHDDHWSTPTLTVTQVIQKSSNIGATQIGLKLTPQQYWEVLHRVGFGERPGSGFPGETGGIVRNPSTWKRAEQATMSYGYGLTVSLLQLAHAYMAFANDGEVVPVTFLKREPTDVVGERVFSPEIAREVRTMMEAVTADGGTGTLTRVPGYRIAGKTGTAHKLIDGRYSPDRYRASFVGMAPASDPRLIIAVSIDEPTVGSYYGGSVAGPVFAQVMSASLRQLHLPMDAPETLDAASTRMTRREAVPKKPAEAGDGHEA